MTRKAELLAEVESLLGETPYEVVDVTYGRASGRLLVRIAVDKEGGVSLDDCARVSRAVGDHFETQGVLSEPYVLEVSSPGINRPLRRPEDYRRFAGETAEVETHEKIEGRHHHLGVLAGYAEALDQVMLRGEDGATLTIPRGSIRKANLKRDPWAESRRER